MEAVLAGKFRILSVLHQSGKRIIYEAVDLKDGRQLAIKMAQDESQNDRISRQNQSYNRLLCDHVLIDTGFAVKQYCSLEGPRHFIVLDLLGQSLQTKLKQCGGTFSYKTTLMLADQMLRRLEALHDTGMAHRDVKPASFLTGKTNQKKIYLIDLGAASKLLQKGKHIEYSQGQKPHGTLRFCSINAHLRAKLSRRDDLHSLMYCILYFLNGRLPWQGMQAKSSEEKEQMILGKKVENRGQILFKKCPEQLRRMVEHIQNLHFADKPDYEFLKSEIAAALRNLGQEYDFHYDWDK